MPIRPIHEEFRDPNHYVICRWSEGVTFHQVELAENMHFAPWKLINSSGTAIDIAADTGQAELKFLDPRNQAHDILYLKTQTDSMVNKDWAWLLHGAIGLRPSGRHLRAYLRFQKGGYYYGQFPEVGGIQGTSSGNFLGDLNGLLSPYENPTNYRELWIPPQTEIAVEFYNDDPDRAIQPVCNLMFRLYYLSNLNPNGVDYEREVCKKLAQGSLKSKIAPMGPSRHLRKFGFNDWKYDDGAGVKAYQRSVVARGEL